MNENAGVIELMRQRIDCLTGNHSGTETDEYDKGTVLHATDSYRMHTCHKKMSHQDAKFATWAPL